MEKDHAMKPLTRAAALAAIAPALATAACNRPDATGGNAQAQFALPALPATLPLEAGAATEIAPAPSASDLPDAAPLQRARVADPREAYGYADAAYSYDEALGDAPPDYGFDYEGSDPWTWQGYDDSTVFAEPIDDGYRYYYYRSGADEPYFVRDPYYSYGFAGGLLAVIYAADGGIVPYADYGPRLGYASRYYARGRDLWSASRRAQRRPVIAADWLRQRPVILAARERWGAGRAHQPAWQQYHEANRPRQAAYWQAEQVRRQADARRFADWRQGGFRTAPPPRAIPAAWQGAKWARDDRRYRPADAVRDRREVANAPAERGDARQERVEDRRRDARPAQQQDRREQAQARRQQPALAERPPTEQRHAAQTQQRQAAQDQHQAARAERRQSAQAEPRLAVQAPQREARQAQSGVRRGAEPVEQRQARQADRQQARQPARQQPPETGRREAQQAERAQRQQAQAAERQQVQQAERAQRQQAQAGERQQAQQARHAERQASRQEAQQAYQAERQQAQPQPRAERGNSGRRGPGPN